MTHGHESERAPLGHIAPFATSETSSRITQFSVILQTAHSRPGLTQDTEWFRIREFSEVTCLCQTQWVGYLNFSWHRHQILEGLIFLFMVSHPKDTGVGYKWTVMELARIHSQLQGSSATPSHFVDAETCVFPSLSMLPV